VGETVVAFSPGGNKSGCEAVYVSNSNEAYKYIEFETQNYCKNQAPADFTKEKP
jgi:hypothetical protein